MNTKEVIVFGAHNHPDDAHKLIPLGTETDFYYMDGTKKLDPINNGRRLLGSRQLVKKEAGDLLIDDYEFLYEGEPIYTDPPIPPTPDKPKADPKKAEPVIKISHVMALIANAFAFCMLLVLLLNHTNNNRPSQETPRNYLTFEEVIAKLAEDGYRIVEASMLGVNEQYAKTITSDVRWKLIGSKDFMYRDGSSVPREIIVKSNEIVDVGTANAPFSLKVRGTAANTKIALLYKMDNGIDIFRVFTRKLDAMVEAITGFAGIVFWIMVIILAVISFALEIFLLYRAFLAKPKEEASKDKCQDKKAPAKC